ncbi:hypothetical protein ABW20_dc0108340 [Dactylellina cionopaga]|nr:hypothetical protein ABW20_dc0108340 [Dactylellina cionopaga]
MHEFQMRQLQQLARHRASFTSLDTESQPTDPAMQSYQQNLARFDMMQSNSMIPMEDSDNTSLGAAMGELTFEEGPWGSSNGWIPTYQENPFHENTDSSDYVWDPRTNTTAGQMSVSLPESSSNSQGVGPDNSMFHSTSSSWMNKDAFAHLMSLQPNNRSTHRGSLDTNSKYDALPMQSNEEFGHFDTREESPYVFERLVS